MRRTIVCCAALSALAFAINDEAWAQSKQGATVTEGVPVAPKVLPAPRGAFEIGVDTAFTQPFGELRGDRPIGSVVDQGFGLGVELNYRINPVWAIGIDGTYHWSSADDEQRDDTSIFGGTVGLHATAHMMPYGRVDPYLTIGTGYRLLMESRDANDGLLTHGWEVGKAKLGLDIRVSPSVAIGPFIAADLNRFFFENPEGPSGDRDIANTEWSTFLSAGLSGRFDIGGRRVPEPRVAFVPARTTFISETVPPPAKPAPAPTPVPAETTQLVIDAGILSACGIESSKAYFDFDSAVLQGAGRDLLDKVAQCVSEGPLKGRSIAVVGYTDPRGTDQYNEKLGQSRAQSVSTYLGSKGVPGDKMATESRGEKDATGVEEKGWSYDRRVYVRLAD